MYWSSILWFSIDSEVPTEITLVLIYYIYITILEFGLAMQILITALIIWRVKMAISYSAAMSAT